MSKVGAPEKLIVDGKRLDGRGFEEFRKIKADVSVLERATGSGYFAFENTKSFAASYGPKPLPKHRQDPEKAILRCKYTMAPFSTKERVRPGHSRRSIEISKVISEAFSSVVFLEDYPKTVLEGYAEVIQADASTRCAALNAIALAFADAGIPMRDLISSCSVGKIDGQIVLDISGLEDNYGEVDMAVATLGGTDKFVLLQMDGIITKEEFSKMLRLSKEGCKKVYDILKDSLKKKYTINGDINEQQ